MYESFYGFREKPFSLLPDPGFLYFSKKHRLALSLLEYGLLNQAGFSVITGGIGTGKTTLIRQLLNNIDDDITVGLISNTHRSFGDLLQWILMAFNLDHKSKSKAEAFQIFNDFLIDEYSKNKRTVLIVDEAQNLAPETLEELRMLSNINADKDQVIQVILSGQAELRDTLKRPDLVQFAQRITVDFHLEPLSQIETHEYIEHRIITAGGPRHLFEPEAMDVVYQHSGGIPRLVNLLCDTALVYGFAEQADKITAQLVADVATEKTAGGIFPSQAENTQLDPEISRITREKQSQELMSEPAETNEPEHSNVVSLNSHDREEDSHIEEETESNESQLTPEIQHIPESPVQPENDDVLSVLLIANSDENRSYLKSLLSSNGMHIYHAIPFDKRHTDDLESISADIVLVDLDEDIEEHYDELETKVESWNVPVLFNDSMLTSQNIQEPQESFIKKLILKLNTLVPLKNRANNA